MSTHEAETPPDGFDLRIEAAHEGSAALGGIVARDTVDENDAESPVNGVSGEASDGDDDVVEDAGAGPLPANL